MTATVKIAVNPSRAAVFLDGLFVGHVGEFEGAGRGVLVVPGTHQIKIALPGYQTFETDINPIADQKVEIKTDLVKNGAPLTEPRVKTETGEATPPSVAGDTAAAPAALKCTRRSTVNLDRESSEAQNSFDMRQEVKREGAIP